jgi:hypothetical protein
LYVVLSIYFIRLLGDQIMKPPIFHLPNGSIVKKDAVFRSLKIGFLADRFVYLDGSYEVLYFYPACLMS